MDTATQTQSSLIKEEARSMIVGRKKVSDDAYNPMITLFDIENPHLTTDMPKKVLEFQCTKVKFASPITFDFLTMGNDIVVNGLSSITIKEEKDNDQIIIEVSQ